MLLDHNQKFYHDDPGFLTFFEGFLFSVIHYGAEANILLDVIEKKKATDAVPWLKDFVNLYFEVLEPSDDPELYKQVTVRLNDRKFSEPYFSVLQELMGEEERMRYIEKFHWDKPAYVLALCM